MADNRVGNMDNKRRHLAVGEVMRMAGFLLGSVSARCAAAAQCPVMLVKAPRDTAET